MTQTKPKEATSFTSKWKTYPAYKDSGVEWLGEIPEHWTVKRLKYVIQNGLVNGLFKKKDQFGSGTKLVNVANLYRDNFLIDFDSLERVEVKQDEYETFNVLSGDIFCVRSSLKLEGVGSSASIIMVPEPTVFECHVVRIRPSSRLVISKYLINYLNSSLVRQRLVALAETTTMTTISQTKLASLEVIVPSLPEQLTIAAFLDRETAKINTLIAKKERLIELLQERRSALISHAVTKGLDPTVKMKNSGVEWLGEIPEHWKLKRLKFVATFFGGGTPSKDILDYWSGDIPWVSPKDMKSELIHDAEDHITKIAIANSSTRLIQSGAVLIVVRSGILRHSIPVAINVRPVAVNQDMKALVLHPFLKPEYLAALIRGHQGALLVEWRKEGATVESIEHELLVNTACPIPPLTEQQAITNFIGYETAKIDALISRIRDGIEKLKEYSTALISAAVTGKIDVRGEIVITDDEI